MSDIVERLRKRAEQEWEMLGDIHIPLLEAADEITKLRAEVERLREALEECLRKHDEPITVFDITRTALGYRT